MGLTSWALHPVATQCGHALLDSPLPALLPPSSLVFYYGSSPLSSIDSNTQVLSAEECVRRWANGELETSCLSTRILALEKHSPGSGLWARLQISPLP